MQGHKYAKIELVQVNSLQIPNVFHILVPPLGFLLWASITYLLPPTDIPSQKLLQ
jgi:hypothetical protein